MANTPTWDDTTPIETPSPSPAVAANVPTWESTSPHAALVASTPSALEAAGRGALQGGTLGFSDEVTGGGEALFDKVLGNDKGKSLQDLYTQHTAEARAANAAAESAHPYAYGAGNLAGGLASGALTGGLGAETALGRVGVAAGMGAASGIGFGNASTITDGAEEALKGALVGGVVGGAVEGVSRAFNPATLEGFANTRAAAALGADKSTVHRLGSDVTDAIGQNALEEGIVTPLAGTSTMMDRAAALRAEGNKGMNNVYSAIDDAGVSSFNPADAAEQVENKLAPDYRTPINKSEWGQLDNTIESINARGADNIPMSEAQSLKNEINTVGWPKGYKSNPALIGPKQKMAQDAWGVLNDAIDEAASRGAQDLGEPGLPEALNRAKDQVSTGKGAMDLLSNREAREKGNKLFGLTDTIAAAGGYAAAGPKGLLALAAKKATEAYGNQTVAYGANKLADVLRATPEALGPWAQQLSAAQARGGVALAATNSILSQTNEAYREHMKTLFGSDQ